MAVSTFTASGTKATTAVKLPKDVFAVEIKTHELLKDAYVAYLANGRENFAVTKKRGEVSGGGRKPWKQKGTGRARTGSIRNPIWRGGGITFGPSGNENYSKKISVKAKRTAIRQALTLAAENKNFAVIEDFTVKDGKTKSAIALLAKLNASSRTLLVVDAKTPEIVRSVSNIPEVKLVGAKHLNVFDVMNATNIVVTKDALKTIEAWLGGGTK
jgi:large subunit ribosomal protein L4